MNATKARRLLAYLVSAVVVLALVALWVDSVLDGRAMDMLWQLAVLVIVLASVYTLFGRRAFDAATETAKDLAGEDTEDGTSE